MVSLACWKTSTENTYCAISVKVEGDNSCDNLYFYLYLKMIPSIAVTNCYRSQAYNFLPSISAASGDKEPQISVWWWCIVLHTPGRYLISLGYISFYRSAPSAE